MLLSHSCFFIQHLLSGLELNSWNNGRCSQQPLTDTI